MTAGVLPFTHPGDTFEFETTLSVPTGPNNFKIVINTTLTTNRAVFKFTSISVTSIGPNLFPVTSAVISDVATFGNGEVNYHLLRCNNFKFKKSIVFPGITNYKVKIYFLQEFF